MGNLTSSAREYGPAQLAFLNHELDALQRGNVTEGTLRFKVLLAAFRALARCGNFFRMDISILCRYLDSLGPMQVKEVRMVLEGLLRFGTTCEEDALIKMARVLIAVRIALDNGKNGCVSPSVDPILYRKVVKGPFQTPWNLQWMGPSRPLFDFSATATIEEQKRQLREDRSNCLDPVHSSDAAYCVLNNDVFMIWDRGIRSEAHRMSSAPPKPLSWRVNAKKAVENGEMRSLLYDLYLVPQLINMPARDKLDTLAHTAVRCSRLEMIDVLHQLGCDFHQPNVDGMLPIHLSMNADVVMALAKVGCDVNSRTASGKNLLELKSDPFNKSVILRLLELGANVLDPNPEGWYWMEWVAAKKLYGDIGYERFQKMVKYALRNNTTAAYNQNPIYREIITRSIEAAVQTDFNDLCWSVDQRNIARIHVLLGLGVMIDCLRETGDTNLMVCAQRGDLEIANILVRNFSDTNLINSYEENSFRIAARFKHWDVAKLVQKYGAEIDVIANDGLTVLHWSYTNSVIDVFMFCLDQGCSTNAPDAQGLSVQFIAFLRRDDQMAEMMQERYHGDINLQDTELSTLGHLAVRQRDLARLEYLISRRLGIEIKNKFGRTIFMESIVYGYLEISEMLLEKMADINTVDECGNTPLLFTILNTEFKRTVFDFLMSKGCDVNIHNGDRIYPLSALIARKLDEEADIVLSRPEVKIKDLDSQYEPIAAALERGSREWFEKLVYRGADARNTVFPVVARYIQSDFYDLEVLKKIDGLNLVIGSPLPVAMNLGRRDTVMYLWETSDSETKAAISRTKDADGKIPLTLAILSGWESFATELMNKQYCCGSPDNTGTTPLMYCAKLVNRQWTDRIYNIVGHENAAIRDCQGNSTLTYCANNGWEDICNHMFCDGIELNCNRDKYDIINHYVYLVDRHKECIGAVTKDLQKVETSLSAWLHRLDFLQDRRRSLSGALMSVSCNSQNASAQNTFEIRSRIMAEMSECESRARACADCIGIIQKVKSRTLERQQKIISATRADLLANITRFIAIAGDNNDVERLLLRPDV